MAALSEDDIEKLFSGAPQYFARTESHYHGAPHPSVAFPFDEELEIRDLTDHVQIEDRAWSGVTAWPHITRDQEHDAAARRQAEEKHRAHFYVRCRERPNMLSMHGVEKGTMGYQAALELSAADSLEEEQFGFESVGTKARAIVDARERILGPQGWLHRLPEHELLDRLRRNADLYRRNDLRSRKSADTYADLFHAFMRPCNTVIDRTDRHSLSNQIVALLKCMGTANVWIDLSRVEWRIRLGQVLWGEKGDDDLDDATAVHDADSAAERAEEKYWLFMQILVASELLLRLDAVTDGVEFGSGGIKPIDVAYFERGATQTVKWSLMLARSWLENVEIIKEEEKEPGLYGRRHLLCRGAGAVGWPPSQRQVDGLIHFARNLMWPGIDRYEYTISERAQIAGGATPTKHPSSSTTSVDSEKPSSYFGAWDTLCHYLMATLLENDREAMAKLGPCANLSGGFVYSGKSFWSTSCIVGRVLAAGKGAAECMGWISTDVVPEGRSDGWLSIEAEDVADDLAHLGKKARIWADFIVPHETGYSASPPSVYVELLALELSAPAGAVPATPLAELIPTPSTTTDAGKAPEIISYPASIRFSVSVEGRDDEEVTYPLTYDISFVTAHPRFWLGDAPGFAVCEQDGPPLHKYYNFTVIHISELLQKPRTTLSEFLLDPTLGKAGGATNGVLVVDCITNLADAPQSPALERVASSPSGSPVGHRKGSFSAAAQMFLESRKRQFGSDMEVLVRALCAQRGWNALVSRRKRGCLACAIREAGALGWKVIVRVE
ncbi:hypothetical protein ACCO45_010415 [Purpureocillium lilacinum]|uniref:Uncharacterized protein n=1 Tax=Purpureocillium lilacinum TaxID=33203 RepID=A0ACC4DFF6_PURLI